MEKIRINNQKKFYEIESINLISTNILQITFVDSIPVSWGDIYVYTSGGYESTILYGYDTIYRDEGRTIYLSNDGSIYQIPIEPELVIPPAPYCPTEEELLISAKSSKKAEISSACEKAIYNGIDVTLANGIKEHFSLTEHDQLNLFGKQAQIIAGVKQLEYHADGQPCKYYSSTDMETIIQSAMWHVSYHTTYCNALNMWIKGCESVEEVNTIYYSFGENVPEIYRNDVLNAYLKQINEMTGNINDEQNIE